MTATHMAGSTRARMLRLLRGLEHDTGAAGGLEPAAEVAGLIAGLGRNAELEHRARCRGFD